MSQQEKDRKIEKIIAPLIRSWEGSNEPWVVKSNLSQFVYSNKRMYKFIGLPENFQMEGRFDRELPLDMHEFEPQFQAHDRKVERVKDCMTSVEVHRFDNLDCLQPWYSEKFPIIDTDGTALGVIGHCYPVESKFIPHLSEIKNPTSFMFSSPSEVFSEKQWEIIFYTCKSFSPKMIEAASGIPKDTVEEELEYIIKQLGVENVSGLVEHGLEHGFNNFMPKSHFQSSHAIL